ncbi:hypothetical protein RN607_00600 [Demequina capsici]|uniref:Uncharacterized protein n=1 Tax=Demequina capsici TaxID=3075620 RepID=A0AA96FDQ5_9MICO|nr:hypothetical protein [Demequina sp. PMTSA13]WNM27532.1 hypothetical protein RN607_00600 [Demequina sp. PMTSA13]
MNAHRYHRILTLEGLSLVILITLVTLAIALPIVWVAVIMFMEALR